MLWQISVSQFFSPQPPVTPAVSQPKTNEVESLGKQMSEFPVIEAEMTFLSKERGGRSHPFPPNALKTRSYYPHIVLGDVNQREAIIEIINGQKHIKEEYLGVAFCDGPEDVPFDAPIMVKMVLMYFPLLSYSEVIPGETFTLREGDLIVGYGKVRAKYMQSFQE